MLKIGEKLNYSIPSVAAAFDGHDEKSVCAMIRMQADAGADYLDINSSGCVWGEAECLEWIAGLVKENCGCGVMLDSPDPNTLLRVLKRVDTRGIIINSITLSPRFDGLIFVCAEMGAGIVAMPISDSADFSLETRMKNASQLIFKIEKCGVRREKIFMDIVTRSLAVNCESAINCLQMIDYIKGNHPGIKTIAGISNISFGLPKRRILNAAFLSAMTSAGLDAAITDVCGEDIPASIYAAEALLGREKSVFDYIDHCRINV